MANAIRKMTGGSGPAFRVGSGFPGIRVLGGGGGSDAEEYLTIEALVDGVKVAALSGLKEGGSFEWSTDGTTWTAAQAIYNGDEEGESPNLADYAFTTLNTGGKVYLRSTTGSAAVNSEEGFSEAICTFFVSDSAAVYGNAMSMLYGADFKDKTAIKADNNLAYLFSDYNAKFSANHIVNDPNGKKLVLPATTLTVECYGGMFTNCVDLVTAPELPATTLAEYCYTYMFEGCESLTTPPALPALTLKENCYSNMFSLCAALETAPDLPATEGVQGCYQLMFQGCESLSFIRCLLNSPNAGYTGSWVVGVGQTGTFVKAAGVSWLTGTDYIPVGWTVQEEGGGGGNA